jgi:hypothetical protein
MSEWCLLWRGCNRSFIPVHAHLPSYPEQCTEPESKHVGSNLISSKPWQSDIRVIDYQRVLPGFANLVIYILLAMLSCLSRQVTVLFAVVTELGFVDYAMFRYL